MLKQRLLAALVLIPAFLAALWYLPQWAWAALMGAVVLLGADEWARLSGYPQLGRSAYLVATAAVLAGSYKLLSAGASPAWWMLPLAVAFWLVVAPLWVGGHWRASNPAVRAVAGWIVLIPTWIAIVELRLIGPGLVLYAMGMIWLADSAAYFSGRMWGRHKLAPTVSPGKTWEGVAGALFAVAVLAALVALVGKEFFLAGYAVEAWRLVVASWFIVGMSILGDLFESHIKRTAGVKDSGHLIPGHGGVLDRIDSQTAALPLFLALCLYYLGRFS
jgi:phosphatidate cytidylyltransferase